MSSTFISFTNEIYKLPIRVGSVTTSQSEFIQRFLLDHPEITRVLETGFHIGLSAAVMLDTRPDIIVTSFDIFWFDYTRKAKLILDSFYPKRNLLLAGNSVSSIPTFFSMFPDYMPDFVFIDGGHERPVPFIDMYTIVSKIKEGTWIMIDDYCQEHGIHGVIEACDIFIQTKILINHTIYKSGDRGWILGQRSGIPVPISEYAENPDNINSLLQDTLSHYT